MTKAILFNRVSMLALALCAGVAHAAVFTAGAGRADVQIPAALFPVGEFSAQHDPLAIHIVLLDDGIKRLGIIVVDMTSISDPSTAAFKNILKDVAGVAPEDSIVVAAHNFSSPHIMLGGPPGGKQGGPPGGQQGGSQGGQAPNANAAALEAVVESAVRQAATQAAASMQPARIGFGMGISRVNVNRDVQTPSGWWIGANDTGFVDPSVELLRVDAQNGKPLALLVNYAMQSAVMDASVSSRGGRLISSDIEGAVSRDLEAHYPGTVAGWLVGAAGDQEPYLQANPHVVLDDGTITRTDLHEAGFPLVDLQARRLADAAIKVADGITSNESPKIELWRTSVKVPSQADLHGKPPTGPVASYEFKAGPSVDLPVVLIRIGDIVIVGLQTELAASMGARIKAQSPFAHTMVVTMVDGGAKYMPDAKSYDRLEYEARSSRYGKGAAELAVDEITGRLKQMREGKN